METSHPGNIGGVARAMKNMGLSDLRLVRPKKFPHSDATSRAAGASDVLGNAQVFDHLNDAIADCQVLVGASARDRTIAWPLLTARECAEKFINDRYQHTRVGLLFGREDSGLKNEELDKCDYLLRIPCNPAFSSLNLAAAVQVVAYELFVASGQYSPYQAVEEAEPLASREQMEGFYQHLEQALDDIGFLHRDKSRSIMRRLRRIYNRIELESKEVDILRGILRFSQHHNGK
jgi:tRNA/rRNA methyltransferase/tRNA (cytidine32/uridine32-2'-O)-methyltransferase